MTFNLFESIPESSLNCIQICDGAYLLKGFAVDEADTLLAGVNIIASDSPFRQMQTASGFKMSAHMTNAGNWGWLSDRDGYRYSPIDPLIGHAWPEMPEHFLSFAQRASTQTGYNNFCPDVCLINEYTIGTKMSLHQDRDEKDFNAPIVSVSFGLSAVFLLGGLSRHDKTLKIMLDHGDVIVFGGASRLRFHGILPIKKGYHPKTGEKRINLTFRKSH